MTLAQPQQEYINKFIIGDSRKVIVERIPKNKYALLWTSPPYAFAQRHYTEADPAEIGQEDQLDAYLDALIEVAKAGMDVLKPWGSQVWNIGTKYLNKRNLRVPSKFADRMEEIGYYEYQEVIWYKGNGMPIGQSGSVRFKPDYEPIMFFAREDQDQYFFDENATKVPLKDVTVKRYEYGVGTLNSMEGGVQSRHSGEKRDMRKKKKLRFGGYKHAGNNGNGTYSGNEWEGNEDKLRMLGMVWTISPQLERFDKEYCPTCDALRGDDETWHRCGKCHLYRFTDSDEEEDDEGICVVCKEETKHEVMCAVCNKECHIHYAMFPAEVARRVIKSCCPEYVCSQCGAPRTPTYTITKVSTRPGNDTNNGHAGSASDPNAGLHNSAWSKERQTSYATPTGFEASCSCNAKYIPGLVLDPFSGLGTTAYVALEQGRQFTGIDILGWNNKAAMRRVEPLLSKGVRIDSF